MESNEKFVIARDYIKSFYQDYIAHTAKEYWGDAILIMEKHGYAFARLYWYNDDETTVYLDWLNVNEDIRRQGMGKELQVIREEIGKRIGAKTSCLWVRKNTWMHDWYKRRGYVDSKDYENEENAIWMEKSLMSL